MPYLIPPVDQQDAIADYLDAQCARIDTILEEIRWSIEEYKTLKQAIITQAVTNGIRGDRPMKDSGIEWIGEIPADWSIIKATRIITSTQNGLTRRDVGKSVGQIVLKLKNITAEGKITYEEVNKIELTEKEIETYALSDGDFLFVRVNGSKNLVGKCAIFHTLAEAVAYNDHIIRVRLNSLCDKNYFHWYLMCNAGKSEIDLHTSTAAGQYTISGDGLRDLCVVLPTNVEQIEISNYLKEKCAEIDVLIEKKVKMLSELEAYKKSFIYEYVTGKKEVPQAHSEPIIAFIDARALLMCRIIELLKPKGRIHLMKALFCVDCLLDFNRETQYLRQKHGPYDERIEEYEKVLLQKGWASIKNGNSVDYILTETFETYREAYQIYYGNVDAEIQRICEFLRPMKTSQAERVATLLAVWNDFIIDGITPTDKQIVQEVRSNWTPNKANSPESTWMDTLTKMRTYHITPSGNGKHTAHMNENR